MDRFNAVRKKAEGRLIGAAIANPQIHEAMFLTAEHFYYKEYGRIWELIKRGWQEHGEYMSMVGYLESNGIDTKFITEVLESADVLNIGQLARDVFKLSVRASVIHAAQKIASEAYNLSRDFDPSILSSAFQDISFAPGDRWLDAQKAAERAVSCIISDNPVFKTATPAMDKFLGGLHAGQLVVLAGPPGVGKTALAMQVAWENVEAGGRVLFLSLEMTPEQLFYRWACGVLEIPYSLLYFSPDAERDKIKGKIIDTIAELGEKMSGKLLISYGQSDLGSVESTIARFASRGSGVVILDHIKMLQPVNWDDNKMMFYPHALRVIRQIAGKYRVAFLAIHQLNREFFHSDKAGMQHIYGGGEDAPDQIVIAVRENPETDWLLTTSNGKVCTIGLHIVKARFGTLGSLQFAFDLAQQRFYDVTNKTLV